MSGILLTGDTSGTLTLAAPAVAGSNTLTLPAKTGNIAVDGPTFSAYQSSSQTLSSATLTKIQFQTEEWDTASAFDNTTNYRFQPTVAGYYSLTGKIQPASSYSAGALGIYKNGSSYKYGSYNNNASGNAPPSLSCLVYLNGSTDYVELWGLLTTGQGLVAAADMTYFQGYMVRGA